MQPSFNKPMAEKSERPHKPRKQPAPLRLREPRRAPAPRRPNGWARRLRRLHALVGLALTLNLLLLLVTGFLVQHREDFKLEDRTISRAWLPENYRPLDGPEVRADIVVTDVHSGRILGPNGALILDAATLGWAVLLVSGLWIYVFGRRRNGHHEPPG
ncbi:MAG TPA: hypothetical protein VLA96_03985 [Terriglobales bacterium]|nr:hypothetical protein [Terriglobales bacterium]